MKNKKVKNYDLLIVVFLLIITLLVIMFAIAPIIPDFINSINTT